MNRKTKNELTNTLKLIHDKHAEYKDIKGMEGFISKLAEIRINVLLDKPVMNCMQNGSWQFVPI